MLRSLRARLLAWYSVVLTLVIATFVAAVCYLFWRSLLLDIDRALQASATALVQALRPAGQDEFDLDLPLEYRRGDGVDTSAGSYYAIWNRRSEPVDGSPDVSDIPVPAVAGVRTRDGKRELALPAPNGAMVLVGRDLDIARERVVGLAWSAMLSGLGALALSLIGGWFLVGRGLAPVARINRAAAEMSAGDLRARIPVEDTEDELEEVARALNVAFDRQQFAVEAQRRFTADASHELRTPLATVTTEVEWALSRDRPPEDYRHSLEVCQRASARMKRIVHHLLALARADEGHLLLRNERVELASVVLEALTLVQPLADDRRIAIHTTLNDVAVDGDRDQLIELVTNLVFNAIQYNHDGGSVSVGVRRSDRGGWIEVKDGGVGIAEHDIPRIFGRFYRADQGRTARSGGAGLGLAIVRGIVDAHRGDVTCASTVGVGTEMSVRLPLTGSQTEGVDRQS